MSYLDEFKIRINSREFPRFFQLWEEYCTNDIVDVEELLELMEMIKNSDMARPFGKVAETVIPLLDMIEAQESRYNVLKLVIDLQTTNSPLLADLTLKYLKEKFENQPEFNDRIRLTGLRSKENFQGAIRNHELLNHMKVGNYVYHVGGWGTGEIVEISMLLEQAVIEFENISGRKSINFINAFKSLIPLEKTNFLVRRFADPDKLEQEAKENPVEIIKLLLRDLGPKNASEIKDELSELVIRENDWTKWWQQARTKLKKDPLIETPENIKSPFRLRKIEITEKERLDKAIANKKDPEEIVISAYNFIRDLPNAKKHESITNDLRDKLVNLLKQDDISKSLRLQILILLETMFNYETEKKQAILEIVGMNENEAEAVIDGMQILALKKKALVFVRENRKDWQEIFLSMLFNQQQSALRDYLLSELNQGDSKALFIKKLEKLIQNPGEYPDFLVWYFQKILNKDDSLPFGDKQGQCQFFEAFLILYSLIENKPEMRDLAKKIYTILSNKRYENVRNLIEGTDIEFIKEFLLLTSKCQSLSDHDLKILRSLAEVVHPSLAIKTDHKISKQLDGHTIWTTEEGYLKIQERLKQIATKEMIENAKEVEAARALGDLRENSEYKFACEKRSRLQGEMKTLSEQLNRARIITPEDIYPDEIGVGSIVTLKDPNNQLVDYTILGPWDVDLDKRILSFQSKFVEGMMGLKVKDSFQFKDEEYTVENIKNFLDK